MVNAARIGPGKAQVHARDPGVMDKGNVVRPGAQRPQSKLSSGLAAPLGTRALPRALEEALPRHGIVYIANHLGHKRLQ